jgi:hypothetical protein
MHCVSLSLKTFIKNEVKCGDFVKVRVLYRFQHNQYVSVKGLRDVWTENLVCV